MSSNLFEVKSLGELVEIEMGQSPSSEFYNQDGLGLPFLQGNRTFGDRFPFIDTYCTSNKKIALENDIIMSVRAPVGDLNIANQKISIGRGICAIRFINKEVDNNFLYYLLMANINKLVNKETGTVFGSVNKNDILKLEILVPTCVGISNSISKILTNIDDKIELNNKMNQTLEKMAQAIFKHWFVDFEFPNKNGEPYKSSGGEMIESELGLIPKSWEIRSIYEVSDVIYGFPYKSSLFNENGVGFPLIRIRDLKTFKPQFYTNEISGKSEVVYAGDILVGMDAEFKPCIWSGNISLLNQRVCKFKPNKKNIHKLYVYYSIRPYLEYFEKSKSGTTVIHLGKSDIDNIKIHLANDVVLESFFKIVNPLFEKMITLKNEISLLMEIRDKLLPKLMSGEIDVSQVEI